MLTPKLDVSKDDVQKQIVPLTISGTPDQLDQGFILAVSDGLRQASGLQSNIKEYEASIKKANTKAADKGKVKDIVPPEKKADTSQASMFDDNESKPDTEPKAELEEKAEKPKTSSIKPGKTKKEDPQPGLEPEDTEEEKQLGNDLNQDPPFEADDDFGDDEW